MYILILKLSTVYQYAVTRIKYNLYLESITFFKFKIFFLSKPNKIKKKTLKVSIFGS